MIPGIAISELSPENIKKLKKLYGDLKPEAQKAVEEIMHQFGFTEDEKYNGLKLLVGLLYTEGLPILKSAMTFFKNLLVLEGQVIQFLELSGADIESGIKASQKAAIQGGVLTVGEGLP